MQPDLELGGLLKASGKAELRQLVHFARDDVGGDGDDALAAERHDGGRGRIVAAPEGKVRRTEVQRLLNEVKVVACLLDAHDVRVRGELLIGLRRAAYSGARGDVVEDERDVDRVGNGGKMAHKAVLRGFVVVWRDGEQRIGAGLLRGAREGDGRGGAVCAAACDDGHAMVDDAHAALDERAALF